MGPNNVERFGFIVLATDCQENTLTVQVQEFVLEIRIGEADAVRSELDSVESVFTDNASPHRVIQVEDQALFLCATQRLERYAVTLCHEFQCFAAPMRPCQIP